MKITSIVFVSDLVNNVVDDNDIVENVEHGDENVIKMIQVNEHSRLSKDEALICAPPYSLIMSDVADCANIDDNLNKFDYDEMVPTETVDVLFI